MILGTAIDFVSVLVSAIIGEAYDVRSLGGFLSLFSLRSAKRA